jgi:hypothetical protein
MRLYFEPLIDCTRTPPVFVCLITSSAGDGRYQVGPIPLPSPNRCARAAHAAALFDEVRRLYGIPVPPPFGPEPPRAADHS